MSFNFAFKSRLFEFSIDFQYGVKMADKSKQENSLGIPKAEFIDDVEKFIAKDPTKTAPVYIKQFADLRNKYKYMHISLIERKRRLKIQIPDIKGSLDAIKVLEKSKENGKDIETKYLLKDQVFVPAVIPAPKVDTVILCLGANVMVEYPLDEAKKLLTKNLELGEKNLKQINEDIDFVSDQVVTTEVNMARLHNWEVERKQKSIKK